MDQDGAGTDFSVGSSVAGDCTTVVVRGEVDMSNADEMVQAATRGDTRSALMDLRGVTFFDSAAIHALIRLAERFPEGFSVLPSRQVRRVLDISGLSGQPWLVRGEPG